MNPKNSKFKTRVLGLGLLLWGGGAGFLVAYDLPVKREVSPKKPVNISAAQLLFDRLKSLTLFEGKVRAVHDKVILTADKVWAVSENREASALGNVKVVDLSMGATMTCGSLEYLDLMNTMTAHDQPQLVSSDSSGKPLTISGRQMEMDSQKKIVVVRQNVQIFHEGGRAEAQKATYLSKDDKFILEENPKVFMPNGQLSGRRIVSGLGSGESVLVEGMAEAVFYPKSQPLPPSKNPNAPTTPLNGGPLSQSSVSKEPPAAAPKATPSPAVHNPPNELLAAPTAGAWGSPAGGGLKYGGH